MRANNVNQVFNKLNTFIKKYYQNQLIKGGIYVISMLIIFFLLFAVLEHFSSFGVSGRTFLFWTYLLTNLLVFSKLIIIPMLNLFQIGKTLDYKQASKIIGKHFPEIDDKLLNLLELAEISDADNKLITASINQKTKNFSKISFNNAIDFSVNKKHLKWMFTPIVIILIFIISGKEYILTESSARIIKHNTFFEPKAPFSYILLNPNLSCKQFDDFLLQIKVVGHEIPSEVYIKWGRNKYKMNALENNSFEYQFLRIHSSLTFQLSAGGYLSKSYTINSLLQPKVVEMKINVVHPEHTNKKPEQVITGDLIVTEGSQIKWDIQLENTNNCSFIISDKKFNTATNDRIQVAQTVFNKTNYIIASSNSNGLTDSLSYTINVIKDQFPKINVTQSYDTINNQHLFIGRIEDDYLISKLEFVCSYTRNDSLINTKEEIIIQRKNLEKFFYIKDFEEINIDAGKRLNYYFRVWDNDGVNGAKFTNSKVFSYQEPSENELMEKKDLNNKKTKNGLNQSIMLAEDIQKEIEELNQQIIEKKEIGWEEKQKAKQILKKQKQKEKEIINTQKQNSANLNTQKNLNPSTLEKQKQLETLMNSVLDEEMKKLLEEMDQMMDKYDKEKLKDLLERLNDKNSDLEKELDRELELFKQLEIEQKIDELLTKIEQVKKDQHKLNAETRQQTTKKDSLIKKQELITQEMTEIKKSLKEIREKNMQLEDKKELPKTQKLEEEIMQSMQKSKNELLKNQRKKSIKSQKIAIEKMNTLEEKLQSMQKSSSEDKPIEDMETLRKILENLIKLSFDQEHLINRTKKTSKNSPEFVKIVQQQNKISDDSKIIEDSLFALSKRVLEIQATINQEITSIKSNMKKATSELEIRDVNKATERQQFVMTSTNNLALLLSEILEQMQKQLEMPPSKCNTPKNCNKPNPNCKKPSMSEIKNAQKKLNGKMKKVNGKNKGKGRSEELMKLVKKQEQIRNQLMKMRDEIGENGEKGKIDKILEDMQENEWDIVNNQITQETINRQKEILTRLLESENSTREQDMDDKRQSTEWKFNSYNKNPEFLKYQKQKKAQEELLKTTPLQLTPFYKNKVNQYFNYIIND